MLKNIPVVPLDPNRDAILIKKRGKILNIPFTDIDRIEMEIRINSAMWGFPEYYVLVIYLKNGEKYEKTIQNPAIFEEIYAWGIEKGIIDPEKEKEYLIKYRNKIMKKAVRNSIILNRISIGIFISVMLGIPALLYTTGIKTSLLDLLASSLLFTSLAFIFLLLTLPLAGSKLKAMVTTFLYRNSLFRVSFKEDSGIDVDYRRLSDEKKKGLRAMIPILGFLGVSMLISSPLYFGSRLFYAMLLFGMLSLSISLFMWKN